MTANNGQTQPLAIEVEMHAFGEGRIRVVDIPADRLPQFGVRPAKAEVLGLTFELGQNDFQPKPMPSVSVGDIIRLPFTVAGDGAYPRLKGQEYRRFVVLRLGFQEVAADFAPPEGDRAGFYAYTLPCIRAVPSAEIAGQCRNGHRNCLLARCWV